MTPTFVSLKFPEATEAVGEALAKLRRADVKNCQPQELVAGIPVVRDRCVIDRQESQTIEINHEHRQRVAVEQEAERRLALFEIGDVDTHPNTAAISRAALQDPYPAITQQMLLVNALVHGVTGEPLRQPFFFAADRLLILAPGKSGAQHVLKTQPDLEIACTLRIELGVTTVPKNISIFSVEQRHPLGNNFKRIAQTCMRGQSLLFG